VDEVDEEGFGSRARARARCYYGLIIQLTYRGKGDGKGLSSRDVARDGGI